MTDEYLVITIALIIFSAIAGYIHGSRSAERRARARKDAVMCEGQTPDGVVERAHPTPTCDDNAVNALLTGAVSLHQSTLDFVNAGCWSIVEVLEMLTERSKSLADNIDPEDYRRSIDNMIMLLANMDHGECLTRKELTTVVRTCTSQLTVNNYSGLHNRESNSTL